VKFQKLAEKTAREKNSLKKLQLEKVQERQRAFKTRKDLDQKVMTQEAVEMYRNNVKETWDRLEQQRLREKEISQKNYQQAMQKIRATSADSQELPGCRPLSMIGSPDKKNDYLVASQLKAV
jgi:hypothetical protein